MRSDIFKNVQPLSTSIAFCFSRTRCDTKVPWYVRVRDGQAERLVSHLTSKTFFPQYGVVIQCVSLAAACGDLFIHPSARNFPRSPRLPSCGVCLISFHRNSPVLRMSLIQLPHMYCATPVVLNHPTPHERCCSSLGPCVVSRCNWGNRSLPSSALDNTHDSARHHLAFDTNIRATFRGLYMRYGESRSISVSCSAPSS